MPSVPLFPLGTVVLPGVRLPLRIFEPRYLALMDDLRWVAEPEFGIIAIRRGSEVGSAVPQIHEVGCAVRVISRLDAGEHLRIETSATRRFRVRSVRADAKPYLVADISWLEDDGDVPAEAVRRAENAFTRYARSIDAHVGGLPKDPLLLTASLLDGLGHPVAERQAVLEAGDATARLRAVTRLCRREEGLARVLRCRMASTVHPNELNPN